MVTSNVLEHRLVRPNVIHCYTFEAQKVDVVVQESRKLRWGCIAHRKQFSEKDDGKI